jgi:hypothetical protein
VPSAKSISGKTIRLTDERWVHIVEGHPEMAGYFNDVLQAIDSPNMVQGGSNELLALTYKRVDKLLAVVYIETGSEGFVITAFFSSKINRLLKRKTIWRK